MRRFHIRKGLDLPLKGKPKQEITSSVQPSQVALNGIDYPYLKPRMEVAVGDRVTLGQTLFVDKELPAIRFTSPGSGTIAAIHRGPRRILESVVIQLDGQEEVTFPSTSPQQVSRLSAEEIKSRLLASGLWTAIRTRPFNKLADPDTKPHSFFVTATDSNPLAPDPAAILADNEQALNVGLTLISRLTDGPVFLCHPPHLNLSLPPLPNLQSAIFSGKHPAGNVGTHIHFLDPVCREKTVWHIALQDLIHFGRFIETGQIPHHKIVALGGPAVGNPCLIKTRMGASLEDICRGRLISGENRIISGPLLSGRQATATCGFLGRYHQQVSVLPEDRERKFLGWLKPGLDQFSIKRINLSSFIKRRFLNFTTSLHGEPRAIVPIGSYEQVMPLDILPTFLLRALLVEDLEDAEKLGCLELDEEDVALCSFVCPSKIEFATALRRNLTAILKEMA